LSPRALSIIFCLWPGTNIQDRFKSIVSFSSLVSLPEAQENVYVYNFRRRTGCGHEIFIE
jgi:hypothetical protein